MEDKDLGDVVGYTTDGIDAVNKITANQPDIVLIDLLLPNKDGINIVKEFQKEVFKPIFVMISQVSSKDMIAKAYEAGIEFFIHKPINAIEVENIIRKVNEKIDMQKKLNTIKNMFSSNDTYHKSLEEKKKEKATLILQKIGILGQKGSQDILNIVMILLENKMYNNDFTLKEVLKEYNLNSRTVEQRMRRAANAGLRNIANLGLEDNLNETYLEFSNSLYSFEQVKLEMDYLRGKSTKRGKVNLKKFLESICLYIGEE